MQKPILRNPQQEQAHRTRHYSPHPARPVPAPRFTSARTSYPVFLSFHDSLRLQIGWAWRGLVDAFRWDVVISLMSSDAEVRANALKSFLLNGISLLSIYVFDLLLHPLSRGEEGQEGHVQSSRNGLHQNFGWFYRVLWLLPVVGMSLYLNASWCSLIAKRTFTLRHGLAFPYVGMTSTTSPNAYTAFFISLAMSAYRAVMIATCVFISFALGYVPVVGGVIETVFFCWVDAYYCFEFIWIARGWLLSRRIRYLEERWVYHLAFGLPSTIICMWGGTLANAALFALIFPYYIIMAMHAHPVPVDPYNPSTPASASAGTTIMHPSPYLPIRLRVFTPVTFLNDCIVTVLNFCTRRMGTRARTFPPDQGHGVSARMEEGDDEEVELRPLPRAPMLRQTAAVRRKLD
ncbi:etoposide-induced protein 2.4-domain-containing protein [Russula compacta]|nr:etoposide-induced protein 2.4-domain-containing protein [Russula compacta]